MRALTYLVVALAALVLLPWYGPVQRRHTSRMVTQMSNDQEAGGRARRQRLDLERRLLTLQGLDSASWPCGAR